MTPPALHPPLAALDVFAPALLRAALGSVAILALAALATLALRRASAAARHATWLLGFLAILLLPILSAALPGWHILPLPQAAIAPAPRAPQTKLNAAPLSSSINPAANPAPDDQPLAKINAPPLIAATAPPPLTQAPAASPPATPSTPPAPIATTPPTPFPWTTRLLACWALGAGFILSRLLLAHVSLASLRRRCTPITDGPLLDLLERLRTQLHLRRRVELLTSPARTMPMTWGLMRARLLLPDDAAAWPPDHRRDVLLHELGHVQRRDCLTHFLAQLACALYWFNPLVWFASRRMQVERERACDDLVLNHGAHASTYAQHLLASVTSVPAFRLATAAIAMARPSTLEERMNAILNTSVNRRGLTPRTAIATALLLLTALVPAAILRAQQTPPPGEGAPTAPPTRAPRTGPESPAATQPGRPAGFPSRFGGRGFGGAAPAAATPTLGEGPTCTLDATLYDVRIPVDQIGKLDVEALAKSATSADAFEKALAALGAARPMYRANQSVRLSGDNITIGSEVPVVTNSRITDKGQAINTISYQSTGAIISIAGKTAAPAGNDLDLNIQVAATSEGGASITDKVTVPVMRRATLSHKGPFQPQKPFVLLSIDAGSADKDGKAVAYIARITLGDPQPPTPK